MGVQRGYCIKCKNRTQHKVGQDWFCTKCEGEIMGIEDKLTTRQKGIINLLDKSHLTEKEIQGLLTSHKPAPVLRSIHVPKTKVTYGLISDTHIGHKCYDAELLKEAAAEFTKRKVDFVLHGGDICEGHYESKRPGHIFELTEIGCDAQIKRAVKELSQIKQPIYAIVGNHEHNTFGKMAGVDVGQRLQELLPNFHNLGVQNGEVTLQYGQKIALIHPDGGSSYAISYKTQKIIESLEGGKKPAIAHIGHFHKAEYLFYRNIHATQNACFESQTDFMKNKGLAAMKGYWIITAEISKNGVEKFVPEFFPRY